MFEEATWRLSNRRAWDVVEHLASSAGVSVPTEAENVKTPNDAAFVIVRDVGFYALFSGGIGATIGSSAPLSRLRRRREDRGLYKHMSPEGGQRASLLLTEMAAAFAQRPLTLEGRSRHDRSRRFGH